MTDLSPRDVLDAARRIAPYAKRTPLITCSVLDNALQNKFVFKAEPFQRTGSFKFRGAMNALLRCCEIHGALPEKVVTFSSGNHAQALAKAGQLLGVKIKIHSPHFSSKAKIAAARHTGAEIVLAESRAEAEARAAEDEAAGYTAIPPFDHPGVIAGQGTACLEALEDGPAPDAIFVSCGGGGWAGGTLLAARLRESKAKLYAAEPEEANDAALSYRSGVLQRLPAPSFTIADGARTTSLGALTFPLMRQFDGFYTATEERIIYWTQWLNHLLKVRVEPTSALTMAAAEQWIAETGARGQTLLLLLSGGNIDRDTEAAIWRTDMLDVLPALHRL